MRRAFTLLELLVVVAIIAMLLAILLPALGKAKDSGRTLKCGSALRQIQLLMAAYGNDSRDLFPPHRSPDSGDPDSAWWWATLIYPTEFETRDDRLQADRDVLHGRYEFFRCPSIVDGETISGRVWNWNFDVHKVGYGYNAFWLGFYPYGRGDAAYMNNWWGRRDDRNLVTQVSMRWEQVRSPSDTIGVGDANPKPDGRWSMSLWHPFIDNFNEGVHVRHEGKGNVIRLDGHYDSVAHDEVNDPVEMRRFWDPRWPADVAPWW